MRAAKGCIYGKPDHGSGASRKSDRYPNGRQTHSPGRPCSKATGAALQETGQGGLMQGEQGRVVAVRRPLAGQSIERGHELISSGFAKKNPKPQSPFLEKSRMILLRAESNDTGFIAMIDPVNDCGEFFIPALFGGRKGQEQFTRTLIKG